MDGSGTFVIDDGRIVGAAVALGVLIVKLPEACPEHVKSVQHLMLPPTFTQIFPAVQ